MRLRLLLDGVKEALDLREVLAQRLDRAVAIRQQVVSGQAVDAQSADRDTIGDEVAAAAAELIVRLPFCAV